ncbi:MAG TPA: hypothetical protein VFO16_11840, partial [Pseudonocardiaceae bacterium]|nr:hypothetical protein [Pseudonocardiaceae bacterium]
MTEISCYWACVSKQPRDSSDYRVLSCSASQVAKYRALELPDRPGTPDTQAEGRVDSLPWVTFGRNGQADHQLTMSIMTWTDYQDADNRPVTLTRFFLLPYDQLPGTAGYADLYGAAATLPLPPQAGTELVSLTLSDAPVSTGHDAARHDLPSHDLRWAAATAAVLLESRVIITGPQDADTQRRLAAVDAITRFLPYGYRADLTVASWASYPEQHWQRLCFGPYAAGDLTGVRLDTNPEPQSPAARQYHSLLLRYLDSRQEDRLIAWLAGWSAPLSFAAGAGAALEILQELDLPDAVLEEVRAGRGSWERVRRVLTERGPDVFDERGRYDIFRFALTVRGLDAGRALGPYWSPLLCAAVVDAAHQASGPADADRIASAFVP